MPVQAAEQEDRTRPNKLKYERLFQTTKKYESRTKPKGLV
jgi:hypothetical protein